MKKLKRGLIWAVLITVGLLAIYPVLFLLTGSLMGKVEISQILSPMQETGSGFVTFPFMALYPTFRNYLKLFLDSPEFFVMFWNSAKIAGGILLGQLLVSVPAAWCFARYHFPGKKFLFFVYIALMMMPFQVTMLSGYLVLDKLLLLDTLWAILLPGIFSTFPVFLMYRFFCGIPKALIESAQLDGAGDLQIFFRLGLPLGSSGILSAMVLGFLEYWNLIEQPLTYLKDKTLWPLSLYLPNITMEQAGSAFAASIITLIPSLLVFLAGQDYLEQGILAAAVKE